MHRTAIDWEGCGCEISNVWSSETREHVRLELSIGDMRNSLDFVHLCTTTSVNHYFVSCLSAQEPSDGDLLLADTRDATLALIEHPFICPRQRRKAAHHCCGVAPFASFIHLYHLISGVSWPFINTQSNSFLIPSPSSAQSASQPLRHPLPQRPLIHHLHLHLTRRPLHDPEPRNRALLIDPWHAHAVRHHHHARAQTT